MPRLALRVRTRALPVFTVGWAVVSGPRRSPNAICARSSRWSWPRKKTTLFARMADRISAIVSAGRSPERVTPSMRAPIRPPTLWTVSSLTGDASVMVMGGLL